ncbi:hypothetical protein BS50DRAFT_603722 [Corynespora cassiicola Philippines]|uniref:Pre-mRNA polyadenylation factor Fip1 domain-containing protein n=1 Tax=Corynespora cassiicola Philippines TaxID=1448308 RepID=A0A2T2N9U1_CORCC|nr:hypothetical protein BS50DRAFT_603722 [Corynespora cassiicola Philippines]
MEEEDDDLYGPSESTTTAAAPPVEPTKDAPKKESDGDSDDEPMLESGEEDEDDRPRNHHRQAADRAQACRLTLALPVRQQPQESKAIKIEAPPQQPATAPSQPAKTAVPALLQQPGTAYPAVRTSTIDVNADPIYPGTGKPITQVDMDADLVENSKPWRNPGADQSDYFNYGFDEFTWEVYRQRQQTVTSTIAAQKAEMSSFQQMFGAMGGPPNPQASAASNTPVPGAPTGPAAQTGGGMGGGMAMPPGGMSEDQMQMMFQQMASSGMDPSQMDFGTFMQMAGQGMGGFGGGAQQQGPGFGPGGQQGAAGRGGGGRRGRGGW